MSNDRATVSNLFRSVPQSVSFLCAFALLPGLSSQEAFAAAELPPRQTAIQLAPGIDPQQVLADTLSEFGSQITHVVENPEGGTLVSVDNPTTGQTVREFRSQVRGTSGVTQVESNVCLEIYPVVNPDEPITLTSPVSPTPEQFVQGDAEPWDSSPLQQTGEDSNFSSPYDGSGTVTREQWEKRKAVGWTTTRPGSVPPPEGGTIPPEEPWDYDHPQECEVPTNLNTNPPEVKVALAPSKSQAGQFPYPRPIPLQALVRDFDEVQFGCTGCGSEKGSNQRLFIEDLIGNYKWQIVGGKGSLNDPFRDLDDDLDQEIEDKKKEIKEKAEKLEELKAKKQALDDSRADREKAIKDKIEKLKADKATVEGEIATLDGEIGQLQEQLDEETRKLNEARQAIDDFEKQIKEKNQRIQELRDKIDGKPSPEEQRLQGELDDLERRIEQKKADFERLKAENAQREEQLRQAYNQAVQNLVTARQNLNNIRGQVQATQDQISALENKLYSSPALYDFITRKANITRLGINLRLQHLSGSGLPLSPTQQLTDLAMQFFRAPSANLKQQALDQYAAEQQRLLGQLTQQCQGNPDCIGQVNELAAEASGLGQSLNQAMTQPASGGSPQDWKALEDKRKELERLEASIRSAEQAVTAAEQAVTQAQQTYLDGLNELEQAEVDLQNEITDLETEQSEVGTQLADARRQAEEERLKNTPQWIEEIAQLRQEIEDLERKLGEERIKAEAAQAKKLELENELRDKKEQKKVLERRRDYLDEQIAREEQKLRELDTEANNLEQEIKDCEADLEKLKEELKELEKKRKTAATGTKQATGQQVYLIPPPLEETDGFDKKKFSELKEKVLEAEAEVEKARAAKEKLQDDVYKILKGMTKELWALRASLDAIKAAGEELDKMEDEQSKRKADVAKEKTAEAAEERQRKAELEAEKNEKQGELDGAKEAESDQKAMVDSQQKAVEKTAEKVTAAQEKVERYRNAVAENRTRYQQKAQQLAQKRAALDESVSKLRDTDSKLGRAQDTLSRAIAREDAGGQSNARSEITRLERERETLQQEVTAKRSELQQLSGDFRIMHAAHEDVEKTFREAEAELADWLAKGRLAVRTLEDETATYDAKVEERLLAERRLREAENDSKAQDEKSAAADEATQKPDEDEEVKAAQAEIDKKKAEKDKAEAEKTKATNKLDSLKQQREEWKGRKTAADDALDTAIEDLEKARDELKDFLEESFKEVKHTITLKLTLKDMQPDAWRTPDGPVQETIVIKYQKQRAPDIEGPDDDLTKPPKLPATTDICQIQAGYPPEPKSNLKVDPKPKRVDGWYEPQTIALFYKKGEPLYDLWPPRKEFKDVLVAAATPFTTGATDSDDLTAQCSPGGGTAISVGVPGTLGDTVSESSGPACTAGGSTGDSIVDIPHSTWMTDTYNSPTELDTMVNVPEVKPDECKGETELKVLYSDSTLQWTDKPDENPKTKKYNRTTGLLGDAPTEYQYETKEDVIELRFQVFDGAHKGKPDQKIEWKVTGIQPADIEEDEYGLNGTEKELLNEKTDGSGYSKVKFTLKKRYGLAKVEVKWKRGGTVCDTVTMEILRPLKLRKINVGFAPQNGWEQGEEMWNGGNDYEALANALPEDGPSPAPAFAVGLMDAYQDPVDEKKIEFSVMEPGEASMAPEEMETKLYGLAWSFATDVPEEANLKMKAKVESTLEPVTDPSEVEGEQSTETQNRFLIGPKGNELTIETDEPFVPGQAYSGGAKLIISGGDIPLEFKTLTLEADGVMTEEGDGELPVATDGSVSWSVTGAGGKPVKFTVPGFGFEFTLSSLGITAGSDALVTGKVKVPKREEEIEFEAQMGSAGFYGAASNFPEIEIGGLKLEKGASIIVDMHRERDPETVNLGGNWTGKGLIVVEAKLTLPDALKGNADKPPSIAVKDLFFNETGLNGEIDLAYTLAAKLGKIEFAIEHVMTKFAAGELTAGQFKGKATFAEPWQGSISLEMNLTSEGDFSFSAGTDNPLTAPSLGLTIQLRKVEGVYTNDIFTFTLQGSLRSETFSDFDINNFVIKSTGDVEADISIRENIQIGKGFEAHLDTFYLKKTDTEFALELRDAGFKFKDLLKAENVTVKIGTGPKIKEFELKLEYDKTPVKFNAEIKYKGNSFEGSLGLSVDKLLEIEGIFILGTQGTEGQDAFTYWYIELNSRVAIPLGQTGLNVIQIGGGLGYNYDPPIGAAGGAARNTGDFSFKAAIAIGNVPRGEIFAGRLTMVMVTGRFSLNGKVWVLDKEDSLYGEGQLDTYWSPQAKMEGFVRMVIGLADSSGKLLRFNGQVDFRFAGSNDWYIKSRTLEGALLEKVIAEGNIDIKPNAAHLKGNVRYDLNKEVPLAVVTLQVEVHLRADGELNFTVSGSNVRLNTQLAFRGSVDLDLETRVKTFDLASATLNATLTLNANNQTITVTGNANVSWDTWVHSGSADVDIGYSL